MFIFVATMFFVGCACTGYGLGYLAHNIFDKIFGGK
jgi:hypothetical protein